jgi:hypothetical protein
MLEEWLVPRRIPMSRPILLSLLIVSIGSVLLAAADDEAVRSGAKEGAFVPKPFDCFNFNGPHKGRFHSLALRYGQHPAVLVFAREPEEGKDADLNALLKRLEEAVAEFKGHELHAGVVFLSPDAQSSATNAEEKDPAKLVEEAKKRSALYARLAERAAAFKNVDVAVYPAEGPLGYNINPKAEVSVVFFWKVRVVLNRAYASTKIGDAEIDTILGKVKETLEPAKKK